MKTPPFLMAAGLLFWGWQSDLLWPAAILGLVLESSRYFKARWELSDAEVTRISNFCVLLCLGTVVFAFNHDEGPHTFGDFWQHPNLQSGRMASNASSAAAVSFLRWLPFAFFFFMLAQAFSSRWEFPLETLSPYLRYRRKRFSKLNRPPPRTWLYNVSWPYFVVCLFAASAHAPGEGHVFFWGLSALVAWALWSQRPIGFTLLLWASAFALVVVFSLLGQHGFGRLTRLADWADRYDAAWMARWMHSRTDPQQSATAIGHIGQLQMSSQIVLRVTPLNGPNAPTYLREATYHTYLSPQHPDQMALWQAGTSQSDYTPVAEVPRDSGRWVLQQTPTSSQFVHISCYLEDYNRKNGYASGVLPLPLDCGHLENCAAYDVRNNNIGTVLADGPGLLDFDADFGSGRIADARPDLSSVTRSKTNIVVDGITNTETKPEFTPSDDLAVPLREQPALNTVISQLKFAGTNDLAKIIAVRHYFATDFKYSFWKGPPKRSGTNTANSAIADFLLNTHSGHCEYFATATVLLLRELHIPARYAVGYVVHEPASHGHGYVVRLRDAHAWCLVWDGNSWQTLDTTPAAWIADEDGRRSAWQSVSDFFSWVRYEFAEFRYGQGHLRPYLLFALVPTLGYFLYQIIFHRRRHKPAAKSAAPTNWPGLDSEFYALEMTLIRRGLTRRPGELLTDWLRRAVADPAVAAQREPLRQLLRLHYQYRFDPHGLTTAERADLMRQAKVCLNTIKS